MSRRRSCQLREKTQPFSDKFVEKKYKIITFNCVSGTLIKISSRPWPSLRSELLIEVVESCSIKFWAVCSCLVSWRQFTPSKVVSKRFFDFLKSLPSFESEFQLFCCLRMRPWQPNGRWLPTRAEIRKLIHIEEMNHSLFHLSIFFELLARRSSFKWFST